ncbi:hypothetical protein NE865_00442 [Phthorimaea operculella]|nr:hypothetical protein NE865_00442 [Phthorimaea operculella]
MEGGAYDGEIALFQKMRKLFDKIKEPGYVMNNYYADGLINKLAEDVSRNSYCCVKLNLLCDMTSGALEDVENYDLSVRVFLTRLLAIIARRELVFNKIFSKIGQAIVDAFKEIASPKINPSLRVAYMEVALALASHDTGAAWLMETGIWKEILSLCNEQQTVFVVRKAYKFASDLVWSLNNMCDEPKLRQIISFIVKPFTDADLLNVTNITQEQEDIFCKTIEPMIQILVSIVSVVHKIVKPSLVMMLLSQDNTIYTYVCIIMDRLRTERVNLMCAKFSFWLHLGKMYLAKPYAPGVEYTSEDFIELSAMFYNIVQCFISRRSATVILDFCTACNVIWLTLCKEDRIKYAPLSQDLMLMCLVPTLTYISTKCSNYFKDLDEKSEGQEKVKEFIGDLLIKSNEHVAKASYALRDLTIELDTVSITVNSLKRLSCLKNLLNNEQANLVFQTLYYILRSYDPTHGEELNPEMSPEYIEEGEDRALVMYYVLDMVFYLVQNHNINWQESLEVISLYNTVYNILKRPNLSVKFIILALNVILTTIWKFLPPNLSLLMESKPGSSIHDLGKLIYMKMHDMHWEIRDSALECLLVCTEISYIKFPPFQKQIIENNLINVAATIGFNDHEFYVQVTALRCIRAATKVTALWEQLTSQFPDIQDQLILILRNNPEGVVRREACNVLRHIYQNISLSKLPPTFKNTLYEHMVSSALSDFHWEVQLSALKFWGRVIQTLLNDQGMLDGTFPQITFSKETRKIVTLNDAEIQKRLLRTLEQLSSIGCLTVLVKLLHEDVDVEIMEVALSFSLDLITVLDKYKVPEIITKYENEANSVEELYSGVKDEDVDEEMASTSDDAKQSDKVIEGILNSDDINLLANIYESHMNITKKEERSLKTKLHKQASPYLFVNHVKKTNFKAIIEKKKQWREGIRSLASLLDDVIGVYEINEDVNTLDCY